MSVNLRLGEAYVVSFFRILYLSYDSGELPTYPSLNPTLCSFVSKARGGWAVLMYYSSFGNSPPHDRISVMLFAFINGDFLHHLSRKIDKNVRCHRMSEFKYLCIFIQINTSLFSLTLRARVKYCWEIVPVVTWVSGTSWNCFKRWLNT